MSMVLLDKGNHMPKLDPGYLNKNGKALMLLEFAIIVIAMMMALSLTSFFAGISLATQQAMLNTINISVSVAMFSQVLGLALGLYSRRLREEFSGIVKRFILSFVIAYINVSALVAWLDIQFVNYISLLISVSICGLLLCSLRFQLLNFVTSHLSKKRLLVLGSGTRASVIEKRMRRSVDKLHYDIIGFLPVVGDDIDKVCSSKIIETKLSIDQYAMKHNIEKIVIACDERRDNLAFNEIANCKVNGVDIIDVLEFVENETDQLAIELMYPGWVLYSQPFAAPSSFETFSLQLFNSVLAVLISIITLPIFLCAVIAIKLEDGFRAPVFYRQTRVGINSLPFDIFKLRSMHIDAEKNGAVWAAKDDVRTTRVGRFIRQYRIDELPQLYNVIRGEMGFVGPRPERPEFVTKLNKAIPFYNERHQVKPGLTGWAQLSYSYGASESDALDKLQFDLYYVKNRSYLFDLLIILRTIEVVCFSKGSR